MSYGNMSRENTVSRSKFLKVSSYQVLVDLSGNDFEGQTLPYPDQHFVSETKIQFTSLKGESTVDIIADKILSAYIDGKKIDIHNYSGYALNFSAKKGEHEIVIRALCRYSNSGEGLHRFIDPSDNRVYLYSQFESADARRVFACFEQPDQKATFQLSVIAPTSWKVFSNSPTVAPNPIEGTNSARWDFKPTPPISTYITAIIAGDYHVVTDTINSVAGPIPASIACRQSKANDLDAQRIFETTKRGFEIFEKNFDYPYAFGKYDQIFVPEFNAGAMENAGCVTIRDEYLFRSKVTSREYENRDNTILHELAHMWFGNLVTMTWWDDLWLNESFAEWASHFAQAEIVAKYGGTDPWAFFANTRKGWAYAQDQLPTTHPIAADMYDLDAVEQNFDGITYAKGASVLKLLVSFVGQENFLLGVQRYFKAHAFANSTLNDLIDAVGEASGRDLSWFSQQWLTTSGVNTLQADFSLDEHGCFTRFDVIQTASNTSATLRTHHMAIGIYALTGDELKLQNRVTVDISGDRTSIEALIGQSRGDLILLNDGDLTYAKTRLDPVSLNVLIRNLDKLTDPLARAVAWTCTWDMTRDGEMSPLDYLHLAFKGLTNETSQAAIAAVLAHAQVSATSYSHPNLRPETRKLLVEGLARGLKNAEPGSDNQLSFTKALISAVFTDAGAQLIKGWLNDEEVPPKLSIDAELRWNIITSLARMGKININDIDAELAKDTTNQGAERAAGAKAALANPQTKAQAWYLATADLNVPNEIHRSICANFWQYDQENLLAGYVNSYFQVIEDISERKGIWQKRGFASIKAVLTWLYPSTLNSPDLVSHAESWLSQKTLSAQVIRELTERIDESKRALHCQSSNNSIIV